MLASCNGAVAGDSATPADAGAALDMTGDAVTLEDGLPFAARSFGAYDEPWAVAIEPGTHNVFVTEKGGTAKFFQPASGRIGTIESGLPQVAYGGQGGLGDIAFAPDYLTSGTIYLTWAQAAGNGGERRAALGRGRLVCDQADSCRIEGLTEIWHQNLAIDSNGHFSHKIAFSPDDRYLFLSSGDRQQGDPAQDVSNNLGSVVRLNLDGTPAQGNPLASRSGASPDIWSYGHRNLLGLQFDPQGNLWDLEHGPRGGDEINLVKPGANYGWPVRSNGINYDGSDIPDHSADDGFSKPAISWDPVIGPGDFLFYTGDMWQAWEGQALIAALTVSAIVRVKTDAATGTATEEARYKFPKRLRDIAQDSDGALWVIEDGGNGRLMRLTPPSAAER